MIIHAGCAAIKEQIRKEFLVSRRAQPFNLHPYTAHHPRLTHPKNVQRCFRNENLKAWLASEDLLEIVLFRPASKTLHQSSAFNFVSNKRRCTCDTARAKGGIKLVSGCVSLALPCKVQVQLEYRFGSLPFDTAIKEASIEDTREPQANLCSPAAKQPGCI